MNVFQPFLSLPTLPLGLVDLGLRIYKFASLYSLALSGKFSPEDSDNNSHPSGLGTWEALQHLLPLSCLGLVNSVLEGVEGDKWGHTLTGYLATINFRVISVKKDSIKRSVKKKGSQQPRFCLMSVFQRPIIISIKNTNIASSSEDTDHLPMGELWTCLLLVLNTWLSFSLEKNFPCITFTWEES